MKNRIYYIGCIFLSMMFMGCSGLLDKVGLDTSVKVPDLTENNLPTAVKGMYHRFSSNGVYGQSAFGDEIASDNLTSTYSLSVVSSFTNFDACRVSLEDQLICGRMFSYPYNGIGAANVIINFVDDEGLNSAVARQAKGEALMLRGYCYMLLAERFGKAVITYGYKNEAIVRTQNPEDEVWKQAEDDLLESLGLLGDFTTPNSGSLQASQALLARLYLNRGVLTSDAAMVAEAGRYAAMVTGSGTLALNDNFADNYVSTSGGREVIFRLIESVSTPTGSYQYGLLSPASFPGTQLGATFLEQSMAALYNEPADQRAALLSSEVFGTTGQEATYCVKFPSDINPVWPVVRLSEMHLIVAEVKARQGTVDVTDYNAVRAIRGASLKQNGDFANAGAFLDEIENERRRELVAEGLRWMDMRRFGRLATHLENKGVDPRRVHFPVYTGEIINNSKLSQTEYYE